MTRLLKPVSRVTETRLDASHGPDRNRRIVVTITPNTNGDLLTLRPERTRRGETVTLADVYRFALRCRVNREVLEKARSRKANKAARLARARQDRAEKRLFEKG
jgi:hypothetical protein